MADEIEFELEPEGSDGPWRDVDVHRQAPGARHRWTRGGTRTIRRRWVPTAAVLGVVALIGVSLATGQDRGQTTSTTAVDRSAPAIPTSYANQTSPPATAAGSAVASTAASQTSAPGLFGPGPARRTPFAVPGLARPTPTGLRLVEVIGGGGLLEIDVDAGTATAIDAPAIASGAPTFAVAGSDWVVVRPRDFVANYRVVGEQPAEPLGGLLADGTEGMFAGPGPGELWIETRDFTGAGSFLQLVDLDGHALRPPISTAGTTILGSDGTGHVLLRASGGTYAVGADVSSTGIQRISTGDVLAAGARTLVTLECDDQLSCHEWIVDRVDGTRTDLGPAASSPDPGFEIGSVAPDGHHAVIAGDDSVVYVVDLISTRPRHFLGGQQVPIGPETYAWSDDGRYLVYRAGSALWLYDVMTGKDEPLLPLSFNSSGLDAYAVRPPGRD